MKKIFMVMMVLIALSFGFKDSQSQTVSLRGYDGGPSLYFAYTSLDSTVSAATNYYDWSGVPTSTIYMTYSYTTAGNTDDTLLFVLKGKCPNGVVINLDSQFVAGSTTGAGRQLTLSLTGYLQNMSATFAPYVTGASANNRACTGLKVSFNSKVPLFFDGSNKINWNK